MNRLAALAVIAGFALPAFGAPRAESPEECYFFSDVALVSRALYLEQVPESTADKVIGHVYTRALRDGGEHFVVIIGLIVKAAHRQDGYGALGFAQRLYQTCVSGGGDMDTILGTDS